MGSHAAPVESESSSEKTARASRARLPRRWAVVIVVLVVALVGVSGAWAWTSWVAALRRDDDSLCRGAYSAREFARILGHRVTENYSDEQVDICSIAVEGAPINRIGSGDFLTRPGYFPLRGNATEENFQNTTEGRVTRLDTPFLAGSVYTFEQPDYYAIYVIWFLPSGYGAAFEISVFDGVPGSPARQWVMDILPDLITYMGPAAMRAYVTPSPAQLMPPAPGETAGASSTPTG